MNPFFPWAELARGLRDRFVEELKAAAADHSSRIIMTPHAGELSGSLAGLITQILHLGQALDRLERRDPAAHAAFQRALARTGESQQL